jgi:hypothetical protein
MQAPRQLFIWGLKQIQFPKHVIADDGYSPET